MSKIVAKCNVMSPKQLFASVADLSKQQVIAFLKKTLRLVEFNRDDILDLETLIVEIEDQIEEIKVMGDDPNFPHPYIKAQVKTSQRDGAAGTNYFYVRRKLPGQPREEKGCGAIPFKPGNIYSIQIKSSKEVRMARCLRVYIPQHLNWEQLLEKPECLIDMAWYDNFSNSYINSEVFEFPRCMKGFFSPDHCTIREILPQEEESHQCINLSRLNPPVLYASVLIPPGKLKGVEDKISDWVDLSQCFSSGRWSLKKNRERIVVSDEKNQILECDGRNIFLKIATNSFLSMVETIVYHVIEDESQEIPRNLREKARRFLSRIRLAKKHHKDELLTVLFDL